MAAPHAGIDAAFPAFSRARGEPAGAEPCVGMTQGLQHLFVERSPRWRTRRVAPEDKDNHRKYAYWTVRKRTSKRGKLL